MQYGIGSDFGLGASAGIGRRPSRSRRFVVALATVAMLWLSMGGSPSAVAALSPAEHDAVAFVQRLGDQAVQTLGASDMSLEEREEKVRGLLREGFDFAFIGRFVLGRHWRTMTPEQQSDYLQLFSAFVLKVYSSRLGGYAGETFKITGTRPAGKQDILVRTEIIRPSGPPLDCEWRVRVIDGRQRIIDVMVAGISMAVTQRSEFSSVISRNGFEGLLHALRARAMKMPATASAATGG